MVAGSQLDPMSRRKTLVPAHDWAGAGDTTQISEGLMEIDNLLIMLGILGSLGAGLALGYFWRAGLGDPQHEELEAELAETRKQLESYQQRVTEHFGTTAELFNTVTAGYRAIYEHLAKGANELCEDFPAERRLAAPPQRELSLEAESRPGLSAPTEDRAGEARSERGGTP